MSPARAQDVRIISGTVVQLVDGRATLSTNTGPLTVQLSEDTRYEREGRGTLEDLRPNQWVAVTGRPTDNGQVAQIVRIFPIAQATVPPRFNSPMASGGLMTNAIVDNLENGRLTVRVAGESQAIDTNGDTQVLRPEPATAAEVRENRRIAAIGTLGGDAVLQAVHVNLLGEPGGVLP